MFRPIFEATLAAEAEAEGTIVEDAEAAELLLTDVTLTALEMGV